MRIGFVRVFVVLVSCIAASAASRAAESRVTTPGVPPMDVVHKVIGSTADGSEVCEYVLTSGRGLKATVITYGATLTSVETPDRDGKWSNITLNLESLDDYLRGHPCFGCVVGRYANRIGGAKFTLDGREYSLPKNSGPNHIHGGPRGFDKLVWKAEPIRGDGFVGVKLTHVSPDGHQGFPGRLEVEMVYRVTGDDKLEMEYTARTDKPTHVNLTNHAYWNLGGPASGNVLDHVLMINADRYLPVDENVLPLGEMRPVQGTPMDFTSPQPIGSRIAETGRGYDHCYVLNKEQPGQLALAARAADLESGRVMEVWTTQPGVQLYTANFLDGKLQAHGVAYGKHHGFCLETQHFPDSPNRPEYPSTVLRPGETYRELTVHKFSVLSEHATAGAPGSE